jgi:hypothetical protein
MGIISSLLFLLFVLQTASTISIHHYHHDEPLQSLQTLNNMSSCEKNSTVENRILPLDERFIDVGKSYPFVALDHLNIRCGGWNSNFSNFYLDALGFVMDPRCDDVRKATQAAGGAMRGLTWVSIGLQQIHLPFDKEQKINGNIVLMYRNLTELQERLILSKVSFTVHRDQYSREEYLRVVCPVGNVYHLYEQSGIPTYLGPNKYLSPNDGLELPGGKSLGMGMAAINFQCAVGVAEKIAKFYSHIFHADPEIVVDESSSLKKCIIRMGYGQRIEFEETKEPLPPYDGYHVAVYVNDFVDIYERLVTYDLHWDNPRCPQFTYRTVEDVTKFNEYRFKDIIDVDTKDVIYELEHEVRSASFFLSFTIFSKF